MVGSLSRWHGKKATQPCPCGYLGDPRDRCTCDLAQVGRYRARISGPLLDRIDLHVEVPAVAYKELAGEGRGEASEKVLARVLEARQRQQARVDGGQPGIPGLAAGSRIPLNAHLGPKEIRRWCRPSKEGAELLKRALDRLGLSARGYHRVLRLARTVADLDGSEGIEARHVAEAVQYRAMDRRLAH